MLSLVKGGIRGNPAARKQYYMHLKMPLRIPLRIVSAVNFNWTDVSQTRFGVFGVYFWEAPDSTNETNEIIETSLKRKKIKELFRKWLDSRDLRYGADENPLLAVAYVKPGFIRRGKHRIPSFLNYARRNDLMRRRRQTTYQIMPVLAKPVPTPLCVKDAGS